MTVYGLYSFFLFLGLMLYAPFYFFRTKLLRRESLYLRERMGFALPERKRHKLSLWFHAVSVGEVLSLQSLIKQLKKRHPLWEINFSCLTNTGMRVAKEKLQEADNIFFVPLDFAVLVRKFFTRFKPCVFILAESEFWPNLLREAKKQSKAVLLINGRMSLRSFKRYSRFKPVAKRILKNIDLFLVQTEEDKEKLEKIGISSSQLEVAGNLKSEIDLPLFTEEEILSLKRILSIPEKKKVILAGSTRKGEEEILVQAFRQARNLRKDILFILAPRHPDRFSEVERICQNYGLKVRRRTQANQDEPWDILILDTIGELAQSYALSDVAFVGGSLVPWGGHNLLEPAFYKKPIFFGPHMDNFSFLAQQFTRSQAACITHKAEDLVEMFLLRDERSLKEMGNKAKEILNSLQGATEKTLKAIEDLMASPQ